MSPAIGAALDRVDGRAKVTGTARYSAEIGLGISLRRGGRRCDPAGRVRAIDARPRWRSPGRWPCSRTRTWNASPRRRTSCRRWRVRRHRARASSPCRTMTVHYAGQPVALVSPTATSGRSTRPRSSTSRTTARRRRPRSTGRADAAYEAESLFGGLFPGRTERGDVEAGLAVQPVHVETTLRMAANHHNPSSPPPRPPSGTRTASRSTTRPWAYGQPAHGRPAARSATVTGARDHRVRRRRLRVQSHGLAARRPSPRWRRVRRAAREARTDPSPDLHLARPSGGAGAADRARRRRVRGAAHVVRHRSCRSRPRSTTGRSRRTASRHRSTRARTTSASIASSRATR